MAGADLGTAWLNVVPSFQGMKQKVESELGGVNISGATSSWGKQAGSNLAAGIGGALETIGKIGLGAVAASVGALTAAVGSYIPEAIKASDATDKFQNTLQFAGVDPAKIKDLTAAAQEYADKTIYDLGDIQSMTSKLAANGVKGFDKLAEAAGNLTAAAGGGKNEFSQFGYAMVQINAAGKLMTQDWNQVANAIPGGAGKIMQALKDMGAYTGDFREAMSKGQISAEEFNDAIMSLGFDEVAIKAAQSATTFEGAWGNLEASINKELTGALKEVKPPLTDLINGVADKLVPALGEYLAPAAKTAAGWIQKLADGVKNGEITIESLTYQLGMAAGGFTALIGAGSALKNFGTISAVFSGFDRSLGSAGKSMTNFVKGMPNPGAIVSGFRALPGQLEGSFTSLGSVFDGLGGKISAAGPKVAGGLGRIAELFSPGRMLKMLAFGGIAAAAIAGIGMVVQQGGTELTTRLKEIAVGLPAVIADGAAKIADNLPTLMQQGTEAIRIVGEGIVNAIPELSRAFGQIVPQLVSSLSQALPVLIPLAAQIITSLVGAITENLPMLIESGLQLLQGLVEGIMAALPTLIAALPTIIQNFLNAFTQSLPRILEMGTQLLNSVIDGILQTLPQLIAMLPTIIQAFLDAFLSNLPVIIQAGVNMLMALVNGLIQAIPMLVEMLPTIITSFIDGILSNLPAIIEAGIQLLVGLITGIVQAIPQLIGMLPQIITTIVSTLVQNIPRIITAGIQILVGLVTGIVQAIPQIAGAIGQVGSSILSAVAGFPSMLFESGKKIISGLIDGIKSMFSAAKNAVSGLLSGIRNLLPFSPAKEGPFSGHGWTLYSGMSIAESLADGMQRRGHLFKEAVRDTVAAGQNEIRDLEAGSFTAMAAKNAAGFWSDWTLGKQDSARDLIVRDVNDQLVGRMAVEARGVAAASLGSVTRGSLRERLGVGI